eukprot:gnl/MRDRNA2_/MRDRNA2_393523_c0_seq1.p1 gnl/MRDRNA2_/MRDRNA2_393523_c0~~gnl/MRDRNA2_/MRDRNA2_393523_c0_seq1.p1  ORF type:complete len:152 (+),score=25.19 gnl/MRDRNA2_/MRDRNA2_393523_c0_seq1:24-479(+)
MLHSERVIMLFSIIAQAYCTELTTRRITDLHHSMNALGNKLVDNLIDRALSASLQDAELDDMTLAKGTGFSVQEAAAVTAHARTGDDTCRSSIGRSKSNIAFSSSGQINSKRDTHSTRSMCRDMASAKDTSKENTGHLRKKSDQGIEHKDR